MASAGGENTVETGLPVEFVNLQATHTIQHRARPPPLVEHSANQAPLKIPPKTPPRDLMREQKVQRRASKGGLRSLFSRNKVEKLAITPLIEEESPLSGVPERTTRAAAGRTLSMSMRRSMIMAEAPATPIHPIANIRAATTPVRTPTTCKPVGKRSPGKTLPRPPPRGSTTWDPPPLFQAYPQAIKHAQLSASTLSADSIIRINNTQNNNGSNETAVPQSGPAMNSDAARKAAKSKSKHRRQISGSISKAEWTSKIFVLVTSGYLLQYAGDGSFDRLPEKILQLGKDSVAFASDAIPGKHWVLQISQAMDSDGKSAADSRSLFSRLTFRTAEYRRTTTSLLLVLNDPEEMEEWLMVVRREIETLGGKKHVSETGKVKPDENIMQLQSQPSHRFPVTTTDSNEASNLPTPRIISESKAPSWPQEQLGDEDIDRILDDAVNAWSSPQLPLFTPNASERSVSNSVVSHAEEQLDSLRDGSNRFSYMSSGQRTMITTEDSTPTASPTRTSHPGFDAIPSMLEFKFPSESTMRPNAAAINDRRRSMQTMRTPTVIDVPSPPKHYRHSTYVGTAKNIRMNAVPIQNFSVPKTSGKRWSVQRTSVPEKEVPQISTPTPRRRESVQRVIRGSETSDVIDFRSLSPVRDISPTSTDTVQPTSEDTTQPAIEETIQPLSEEAVQPVDEASSSKAPLTPSPPAKDEAELNIARRRSSLMPLPLSRKINTMQILRESKSHHELRAVSSPTPPPPLPQAPEVPPKDTKSAVANTKSKTRRPFSLQVSNLPFIRPSLKSPKPTSPPSSLTLFPPTKPFASNSRSTSPAFNDNGSLLTAVTILSPVEHTQLQKPKAPYATEPRSSSALSLRKPSPPYLQNKNSSSSLRSTRLLLSRQDSSAKIAPLLPSPALLSSALPSPALPSPALPSHALSSPRQDSNTYTPPSLPLPSPRQDSGTYFTPTSLSPPLPARSPERATTIISSKTRIPLTLSPTVQPLKTRIPLAPLSPTVQPLRTKTLSARKSLSSLVNVNGPPSAPPPDCALPPLPTLPSTGSGGRSSESGRARPTVRGLRS